MFQTMESRDGMSTSRTWWKVVDWAKVEKIRKMPLRCVIFLFESLYSETGWSIIYITKYYILHNSLALIPSCSNFNRTHHAALHFGLSFVVFGERVRISDNARTGLHTDYIPADHHCAYDYAGCRTCLQSQSGRRHHRMGHAVDFLAGR